MNVWTPTKKLRSEYVSLQDELLMEQLKEKGVVHVDYLPTTQFDDRLVIW